MPQNLTDYTLISNIKQIFKDLLKDKLQNVRNSLPTDKSQLPCLIISCIDCKLQPVGLGGIVGIKLKDKVESGVIEGARLTGTFKFDIWVEKKKDNIAQLEQMANTIIESSGKEETALREKGILSTSLQKITDVVSSKGESCWQLKEEGLKKSLEYRLLYEATSFKEGEGEIKEIDVEIKDGFKEQMIVKKKGEEVPS